MMPGMTREEEIAFCNARNEYEARKFIVYMDYEYGGKTDRVVVDRFNSASEARECVCSMEILVPPGSNISFVARERMHIREFYEKLNDEKLPSGMKLAFISERDVYIDVV